MRLRNSVSSVSGTFTLKKGRIAVLSLPVCCATFGVISSLLLIEFVSWSEGRNTSAEHQVREWTSALCAYLSRTSCRRSVALRLLTFRTRYSALRSDVDRYGLHH